MGTISFKTLYQYLKVIVNLLCLVTILLYKNEIIKNEIIKCNYSERNIQGILSICLKLVVPFVGALESSQLLICKTGFAYEVRILYPILFSASTIYNCDDHASCYYMVFKLLLADC